ncbi:MAG: response regulator [Pseudomonadota bacterium]
MARVLIVDDEDEIRFLYKQLLSEAGHLVFVASDAEEAKAILLKEDIDVGLIDRILPGEESGLDILRFIQAERPLCKTILISGYPTFHSASEALRHNAFDYLTKPVGRIKLCETIESAFKQKQLHKQEMLAAEESKKNYEVLRSKQELLQHDMRSMLIGIAGFVNLLINRTILDDTQLEYCKQIQHCSIQLENMINTYLDISRLERPCVELARIEFNFLDIVRQSRKTLHFLADEKNVEISLIYNRKMLSLDDIILFEGDRTYLQSTIDNLVKKRHRGVSAKSAG